MDSGIAILAIIAGLFLIATVIYLIVRPRGQVAGTEVEPEEEFSLQAAPGNAGNYKLWVKYDINWSGVDHEYGLTFAGYPSRPPELLLWRAAHRL